VTEQFGIIEIFIISYWEPKPHSFYVQVSKAGTWVGRVGRLGKGDW